MSALMWSLERKVGEVVELEAELEAESASATVAKNKMETTRVMPVERSNLRQMAIGIGVKIGNAVNCQNQCQSRAPKYIWKHADFGGNLARSFFAMNSEKAMYREINGRLVSNSAPVIKKPDGIRPAFFFFAPLALLTFS